MVGRKCTRAQIDSSTDERNLLCLDGHSIYNSIISQKPGWGARWGQAVRDPNGPCWFTDSLSTYLNDLDFRRTGFQYELSSDVTVGLWEGNLPPLSQFPHHVIRLMAPPDGRKVED